MERRTGNQSPLEAGIARIQAERDTVTQNLKDLGKAFMDLGADITPSLYKEYLTRRTLLLASRVPGLKPRLPKFTYSRDEIQELRGQGREIEVALPNVLTPAVLRVVYPKLASHWTVQDNSGIDRGQTERYFSYEDQTDAPHLGSNVNGPESDDIRNRERRTGETLLHPFEYFVASYDHKDRTNEYFDQGRTWTRVEDPRVAGGVLGANFFTDGVPDVDQYWSPDDRYGPIGARFKGVK